MSDSPASVGSISPVSPVSPASSPSCSPCHSPTTTPPPTVNDICEEHCCTICDEKYKMPRILSCLHVFCTACLEKRLEMENAEDLENSTGSISCPECKQETKVAKEVSELPLDHVMENMVNMAAITDMQIVCTSCKAREKAVARCSDCANFLCPNCVTAHQYMRCFENHKVISFDDLQNGDGLALHKPIFCEKHQSETLKFFCETCQILTCSECILADHKQPEHNTERLTDVEEKQLEDMRSLVAESKGKISFCEEASSTLENTLSELQLQRDNARGLIEETFQTYRTMFEKKKEETLQELEELHKDQELQVMEQLHNIEKTTEKIEDGCKFAERVLEHGNVVEVLLMKKLVAAQLLTLINNTPKPDVPAKIEFVTDGDKFEEAIKATFGTFKKPEEKETPATSLHSSFENEGFALPSGVLSPDTTGMRAVTGGDYMTTPLPPLSIPNIGSLASGMSGVSAHTIHSIASSMQNLNSDRSSSRNSYSPAMSDSGISVDAASTNSANNTPLANNLAALTKLGSVSINTQGQITVNGQVIPGLNVGNINMPPPPPPGGRVQTPTNTVPDAALASLLGSMNLAGPSSGLSGGTPGRAPTPVGGAPLTPNPLGSLPDISNLLAQPSPQLNGIGGLGASGPTGLQGMGVEAGLPLNSGINLSTPPPPTPTFSGTQPPPFPARASGKMSAMQIRCKFGQLGPGKGQFNSPHGFCLGSEEDIIVADTNNHRIQVFEKTGEFKYQFGIPGREEGQLWYPRKVAVMRHSGKFVVCDRGNERSRMQIFTKNGHFIKKIAIRYIDIVAGLAITQQGHIVAVDSVSPTVFCIAETGDLLKWFDCSDYMREPSDIAINQKEYFVCDFKGHCVVVFDEEGQFVRRIGCENITNFPNGIDISDAGDVLVGDSHGNRFHVAVFQRDGSLIGEFECPYVKVSRCCGLKITSEGYVVTLAKNNHHVLVLNTLYIT